MKSGKHFRTVEKNCFDAEARIKDMDKTGIACDQISKHGVCLLNSYPASANNCVGTVVCVTVLFNFCVVLKIIHLKHVAFCSKTFDIDNVSLISLQAML